MKKVDAQALYRQYFVDNSFERESLFKALKDMFYIHKVLYPDSFVHITPSFFFPEVVYVDTDQGAQEFFRKKDSVAGVVSEKKMYDPEPVIRFLATDYSRLPCLNENDFDLLISQYAGFFSQACKKYLKKVECSLQIIVTEMLEWHS